MFRVIGREQAVWNYEFFRSSQSEKGNISINIAPLIYTMSR